MTFWILVVVLFGMLFWIGTALGDIKDAIVTSMHERRHQHEQLMESMRGISSDVNAIYYKMPEESDPSDTLEELERNLAQNFGDFPKPL